MKLACLLCVLLVLTGCSAIPTWETVEDMVPSVPASAWQEEAYVIQAGLPAGAALTAESVGCKIYEAGDMEIETTTFLSSDLNSAVKRLSGYEADRVSILQTSRFGMPEYRFAWYSQTAEGGRLYQTDLVMDDAVCYAVVCSMPEDAGGSFTEEVRPVFAAFGLSEGEMV